MAPEQILGQPISLKSDVWAIGVILWELMAEVPPYHAVEDTLDALRNAISTRGLPSLMREKLHELSAEKAADVQRIVSLLQIKDPATRPNAAHANRVISAFKLSFDGAMHDEDEIDSVDPEQEPEDYRKILSAMDDQVIMAKKLTAFYKKYNPKKLTLEHMNSLMDTYGGKEDMLNVDLQKRYKFDLDGNPASKKIAAPKAAAHAKPSSPSRANGSTTPSAPARKADSQASKKSPAAPASASPAHALNQASKEQEALKRAANGGQCKLSDEQRKAEDRNRSEEEGRNRAQVNAAEEERRQAALAQEEETRLKHEDEALKRAEDGRQRKLADEQRLAEERVQAKAAEEERRRAALAQEEETRRKQDEEALKRAEDERQRKLAEERRVAEERVQARAAEEERRQAALAQKEETRRKQEEEALKRAEDERRRKLAEERRVAEERVQAKAAEEESRQAALAQEEETRRKQEEEALKRAEACLKRAEDERQRKLADARRVAEERKRAEEEGRKRAQAKAAEEERWQAALAKEEEKRRRQEDAEREYHSRAELLRSRLAALQTSSPRNNDQHGTFYVDSNSAGRPKLQDIPGLQADGEDVLAAITTRVKATRETANIAIMDAEKARGERGNAKSLDKALSQDQEISNSSGIMRVDDKSGAQSSVLSPLRPCPSPRGTAPAINTAPSARAQGGGGISKSYYTEIVDTTSIEEYSHYAVIQESGKGSQESSSGANSLPKRSAAANHSYHALQAGLSGRGDPRQMSTKSRLSTKAPRQPSPAFARPTAAAVARPPSPVAAWSSIPPQHQGWAATDRESAAQGPLGFPFEGKSNGRVTPRGFYDMSAPQKTRAVSPDGRTPAFGSSRIPMPSFTGALPHATTRPRR